MKIAVRNKVKMTLLLVIVIGFVGGLSIFYLWCGTNV